MSGDVFIFINRRRNQVKLLSWEAGGLAIYSKRLERGTYELPVSETDGAGLEVSAENLGFILDGIQLFGAKMEAFLFAKDRIKTAITVG